MRFDIIVGNPPYQLIDGGASVSAKPLYHLFVINFSKLDYIYISFVTPSRWFAGGKGLDKFREKMLNSRELKVICDYLDPEDLFPCTNIRGGVNCFLLDSEYNNKGNVHLKTIKNNKIISNRCRPIKFKGVNLFIRDNIGIEILKKIKGESLMNHISSRKPFGLDGNIVKKCFYKKRELDCDNPIKCFGKGGSIGYVEDSLVLRNREWIKRWKVITPYANNIGTELKDDNLNSFVSEPKSVCTETYLVIGGNINLDEKSSVNITTYLKTKFVRFLLSMVKTSQHATSKTYRFVPLQDFTSNSDIDWDKSIMEIDEQLFNKYGLTKEEREHIKESVKEMV